MKRYIFRTIALTLAVAVYGLSYFSRVESSLSAHLEVAGEIVRSAKTWQDFPPSRTFDFAFCRLSPKQKIICEGDVDDRIVLYVSVRGTYIGRDCYAIRAGEAIAAARIAPDFAGSIKKELFLNDIPFLVFVLILFLVLIHWQAREKKMGTAKLARTQCECEGKVRRATEDLRSRNELLKIFIWLTSHKVRNWTRIPLSYRQDLPVPPRLFLAYLQIETQKLEECLESVTVYANLVAAEPLKTLLDLERLVREAWGMRRGILSVKVDRDIIGDRDQLLMFFEQLFDNSCSYCDRVPYVSVVELDRMENRYLCLSILDNGIGIPSSAIDRIGEVGVRPHNISGTGFGLAIAKQILDLHRGSWAIDSSPQGTQFQLFFPLSAT